MDNNSSSYSAPPTLRTAAYLGKVLGAPVDEPITGADSFRMYGAAITTELPIRGNMDTWVRQVVYRVGRRWDRGLPLDNADAPMLGQTVEVPLFAAEGFNGAARRNAAFAGDFGRADLSALIRRLAMGVAHYAVHHALTRQELCGGQQPRVIALASATPYVAATNTVFLPRSIDHWSSPNTFAAIVYACAATGASVTTDVIELNQNNTVVLPAVDGYQLALGCYHALRLIGSNYEAQGHGGVFAYAATLGIHAVVTVVGHTDEGAYMRKVLRSTKFVTPYGGIDPTVRGYTGLPAPATLGTRGFTMLVDSWAIATAAAVASCDPLVYKDGRAYPSLFVAGDANDAAELTTELKGRAEHTAAELDAMAVEHGSNIAAGCSRFAGSLVRAFADVLCIHAGDSQPAVTHLVVSFGEAGKSGDRHLRMPVVAPYYWVEPTGASYLGNDYDANVAGYGPLATPDQSRYMPVLPKAEVVSAALPLVGMRYEHRTARTVGLFVHLAHNPRNGLGASLLRQADPDQFFLNGGKDAALVRAKMTRGDSLAEYAWERGDAQMPAPAEFGYAGSRVGVAMRLVKTCANGWDMKPEHLPTVDEMLHGQVRVTVSRLVPISIGGMGSFTRAARRDRTLATAALQAARDGNIGFVATAIPLSFTDYVGSAEKAVLPTERVAPEPQLSREQQPPLTTTVVEAQSLGEIAGAIAPTTIHMAAENGPRMARAGVIRVSEPAPQGTGAATLGEPAPEGQ